MDAKNPYAPSSASLRLDPEAGPHTANAENVWRDGNVLVMLPNAHLPPRCIKCNESCTYPMTPRTVYWHHWSIYLVLLFNVIIYLIVAMATRRKETVAPGLCRKHVKGRRFAILFAWLGVFASVVLLGASFDPVSPISLALVPLLLLFSIVFGMVRGRVVWAKRIDKSYVRLKGCAPPFLDTLPRFPH